MKKPSIDAAALKQSLLEHGDKIAFGFATLCFLIFAYAALSREKLDRQPDALQQSVKDAQRAIEEIKVPPPRVPELRQTKHLVEADHYKMKELQPLVFDPKGKRTAPSLLALEEPRGSAGFGTFALQAEGAVAAGRGGGGAPELLAKMPGFHPAVGQDLKPVHWVVITGLIPIAKQTEAYNFVFLNAEKPAGKEDEVDYISHEIQRATGSGGQWTAVDPKNLEEFRTKWAAHMDPVTPENQSHNRLTAPLGPLVGVDWSEAVAHPPEVEYIRPKKAEPMRPGAPPAFQRAGAAAAHSAAQLPQTKKPPDVLLYRFFDFNVVPGTTYQYRVRLRLTNPNFKLEQRYLKDPKIAMQEFLDTPWSQVVTVTVPRDVRVFASTIIPPKGTAEIGAKLIITTLDDVSGLEYSGEVDGRRGTLLNTHAKASALDPRNGGFETKENMEFKTDIIVLDIRGGGMIDPAERDVKEGAEVLLVDSDGNLLVREELMDASIVKSRRPPAAPATSPEESSANLDKLLDLTPTPGPATKRRPATGPFKKR